MLERTVDLTIVGGGPVGLFAAFYAGLRGMSVRIMDSLPELGGQLTALYPEKYVYDMPGFPEVLAKDLARDMAKQAAQFQPDLALETTASILTEQDGGWCITDQNGKMYPTKTIIISAGNGAFSPTKIGIPDETVFEGRGLSYGVRDRSIYKGKRVVIVGGGDSAFDWALSLHDIAKTVALVHRRDGFRAHEDTVKKVQATSTEFHLWSTVKSLNGDRHLKEIEIENVQSKTLSTLPCDELVVNIGFKSSLGALQHWGLEIVKNQIQVDHLYRTNLPGVFAVGDVCSYEGKIKLIATGVGEAATAVCLAKTMIDPAAKLFPGHSSDMEIFG